jgi:post-segregation antitoxin (ccd killing protein)
MRHNQLTITYSSNGMDLRTELFKLKRSRNLNVSSFCADAIEEKIRREQITASSSALLDRRY